MAIGNTMTINRLNFWIDNKGFDLIGLSRIPEALAILQQERFDIILIDSLLEEAGNACRCIDKLACAPIALLVRETEANWLKLGGWEVDGFVPEGSGRLELAARIKAISRRRSKTAKPQE